MKVYNIIGLIREHNESLILQDTLNHLSGFVDGIIVFDDASTDSSIDIAKKHKKVLEVIENKHWRKNRAEEETRHRQILLQAAQKYNPKWLFCVDADERFEGDIKSFLNSKQADKYNGIRISLFDAYLTRENYLPYQKGSLFNFRRYFGPERRDILMIWKNKSEVKFKGLDKREPMFEGKLVTKFFCQHYGKALSIEHWEKTCDYYMKHFPKYSKKWKKRKGKAIHKKSDFGTQLATWSEVKKNSIPIYIYPIPHSYFL